MKQPRFSIHDAFEEENDEAIRVYGSTVISNVPKPSGSGGIGYASNNTTTNEMPCDHRLALKYIPKKFQMIFNLEIING